MHIDFERICIIGLGLIGGSIALNLKSRGFQGQIRAIDINRNALVRGHKLGIIDGEATYGELSKFDLIIISTPVKTYYSIIGNVKKNASKETVVTDTGSVKGNLVLMCENILSGKPSFIGSHPIAGTEKSGVENAVKDLFEGAKCIITPTDKTKTEVKQRIRNLWEYLGCNVVEMDPFYHDRVFAYISHLPHMVAYSLMDCIVKSSSLLKTDLLQFVGGGFRDFTRIAMSDETMWGDICEENKHNILESIKAFKKSLNKLEKLLEEENWAELKKLFKESKKHRAQI